MEWFEIWSTWESCNSRSGWRRIAHITLKGTISFWDSTRDLLSYEISDDIWEWIHGWFDTMLWNSERSTFHPIDGGWQAQFERNGQDTRGLQCTRTIREVWQNSVPIWYTGGWLGRDTVPLLGERLHTAWALFCSFITSFIFPIAPCMKVFILKTRCFCFNALQQPVPIPTNI